MLSKTPWSAKPKAKPARYKLTKARRKFLIDEVADTLRYGEPTLFRFSAACRHGLRVAFILNHSWPWLAADLIAAGIVGQALENLGAKYPRWIEGQREYTHHENRLYCVNEQCGRPIPRDAWPGTMYCCEACRKRAKDFRYKSQHRVREQDKARVAAARVAAREKGPTRDCEWCQRTFRALDYAGKKPQRFCSLQCRSRYASSFAAGWRPRLLDRRGANGNGRMNGRPEAPKGEESSQSILTIIDDNLPLHHDR